MRMPGGAVPEPQWHHAPPGVATAGIRPNACCIALKYNPLVLVTQCLECLPRLRMLDVSSNML